MKVFRIYCNCGREHMIKKDHEQVCRCGEIVNTNGAKDEVEVASKGYNRKPKYGHHHNKHDKNNDIVYVDRIQFGYLIGVIQKRLPDVLIENDLVNYDNVTKIEMV